MRPMSTPFRERFEAMVDSLRVDARVEVLTAELMPPASPAALNKAERAIQRALPPAMRAFYEAHNGVFLRWGLKGRRYPKLKRFEFPDYEAAPGCINMLPVEKAMSSTWQKESHLNGVDEDCWEALFGKRFRSFSKLAARLSFAAKNIDPDQAENDASSRAFEETLLRFDELRVPDAVMLDLYSKNNMAALLLGPVVGRPADGTDKGAYEAEAPLVIRASDGGSDMTSNGMSFEAYLDCMLASYGSHRGGFEVDDDPKCIKSWKKKAPPVKKVVDTVIADAE
jgi:hypothetical protein